MFTFRACFFVCFFLLHTGSIAQRRRRPSAAAGRSTRPRFYVGDATKNETHTHNDTPRHTHTRTPDAIGVAQNAFRPSADGTKNAARDAPSPHSPRSRCDNGRSVFVRRRPRRRRRRRRRGCQRRRRRALGGVGGNGAASFRNGPSPRRHWAPPRLLCHLGRPLVLRRGTSADPDAI